MRQFILCVLIVISSVAFAEKHTITKKITLKQAVSLVLERSSLLRANIYESKATTARVSDSLLSPGYKSEVEIEGIGDSDNSEITLSLSKVLELGGKAKLRGDVSRNEVKVLQSKQASKKLDLLAETARLFTQVVSAQEQLRIANESNQLSNQTLHVVKRRVDTGKSPKADLQRAKIDVERKKLEINKIKKELDSLRLKLSVLWGDEEIRFEEAEANLFEVSEPEGFSFLIKKLKHNPDLVQLATARRLADSRIQLSKSSAQGDIELSAGIKHQNITSDTSFMLTLGIPIGSSSRAAPKIEEAELQKHAQAEIFEKHRLDLIAVLFEAHQKIKHSVETLQSLRTTIIPLAESAANDVQKGFSAGRYSLYELAEAQRSLLSSKLEAVKTAADYHRYRIEIDRLTGVDLTNRV